MLTLLLLLSCMQQKQLPATGTAVPAATATTPESPRNNEPDAALLRIKRIFVDSFGDDPISKEMQSMIVSALVASKRFTVTENRERADAVMKGVALEKTSQEVHAYGESTAVGGAAGGHHGQVNGTVVNGNGSVSGSSSGGFIARHMATSDSSVNTETIDHSRVTVRLVNADGDVIWTTTQESKGAKYKGATADAADMCVKQLIKDISKLEPANQTGSGTP